MHLFMHVAPNLYRKRFFRRLEHLNFQNIKGKNTENELLLVEHLLKKNGVFIDIGANLGQYIYMAEKVTNRNNIYAIEPIPKLANRLSFVFKGIQCHTLAIFKEDGEAQFKIPIFNNTEIYTRGTLKLGHKETEETNEKILDVKLQSLKNFVLNNQIDEVSLIKIDVEGAEFDVLEGAGEVIRKFSPSLIIEIEQRHHPDIKIEDKILEFCSHYQYECFYFDPHSQTLVPVESNIQISKIQSLENHGQNRSYINNFIFIRKGKEDLISFRQKFS